jgi:hypothetical protein
MKTNSMIPRASEGGHWYDRDGTPRYEVLAKDGSMRPATVRDARKFGWYPGVTSIIKCAAAPGLERWKQDQNVLAALTMPRRGDETHDALLGAIRNDAEEQARKARDWGTRFHAAIQGHYEGRPRTRICSPYVQGVAAVIDANFGGATWLTEKPMAHCLGLRYESRLALRRCVLDFKGSDFTREDAPAQDVGRAPHAGSRLVARLPASARVRSEAAMRYRESRQNAPGLCANHPRGRTGLANAAG